MAITQLRYGRAVQTSLSYEDALARAKQALKEEGFGVLCEIDVAKTMKEKIGADFRPYVILGACNPQYAHQALLREDQLGLLLPCNVVVQQRDGGAVVSAVDAAAMLGIVGNPELTALAGEVNTLLSRVLERVVDRTA